MGASAEGAEAFRAAGLNALQLGDEAILYPDRYRLSGPSMRAVRQAGDPGAPGRVDGAASAGTATFPPTRWRRSSRAPMTWRDTETERGFSMALGRLGDAPTVTACSWKR